MLHLLTRAEFRDSIRRKLGIVPPKDADPSQPTGAQPTNSPDPTNMQINDALQDAVSDINRVCGFHTNRFSVPVPAQVTGEVGPFRIDLSNLAPNTFGVLVNTARIIDVRRVVFFPGGDYSAGILLESAYRDNLDRSGDARYWGISASMPREWYIEEYSLWITPAHQAGGVYLLTCGTGIVGLECDQDTLDQVPIDYQNIFEYQAIVNLSMTQTMDIEAQSRAQMFAPKAGEGMKRFKEWIEGGTGAPAPVLLFKSNRSGYGTRRTVR